MTTPVKMALLEELGLLTFIQRLVENGSTHKSIAEELRDRFPNVRGISARSVRRFCAANSLHATSRLPDRAVDVLVAYGIGKVSGLEFAQCNGNTHIATGADGGRGGPGVQELPSLFLS